jgi:DNA-binding NtrC family response regulator
MAPLLARSKPAARPRILIVDDEPDVLESMATLVEMTLGADVSTVSSARAALDLLGTSRYSMIVTDFRMPGMDGCELLARASRVAPGTPQVLVSAYSDNALEIRAKALGVCAFLAKPLLPEAFITALLHCLKPKVRIA